MTNSPLQLEEYFLEKLQFTLVTVPMPLEALPKFDRLELEVKGKCVRRDNDIRRWKCDLTIRSRATKPKGTYPYSFEVGFVGFYRVLDAFPEKLIEAAINANGPAILYSAAREMLLVLTGRGRFPAILLPSITFIKPPKKQAVKAKAAKKR